MSKTLLIIVSVHLTLITGCQGGTGDDIYRFMLTRSAEDGSELAQLRLGELYHYSDDPEVRDLEEAVKWYRLAAEQGVAEAADYLGIFYSTGFGGLPRDCEQSMHWYEKAARGGYGISWSNLAWKLSTCREHEHRDGDRALRILERHSGEFPENAAVLDTWAAAYAEAGDFNMAIVLQTAAIVLIQHHEDADRVNAFHERLGLYQHGLTWQGSSFEDPSSFGE